ncbi:MAG: M23 family metallopeptidase [Myxococcota bacterium]|nr:M23 family metallopeptidase [Myxococcota bacterium]
MRRLLPCLLLLVAAPTRADRDVERDVEIALAGVLQQAHDHLDDSWLRRMMAPSEQFRFDEEGGVEQFRRHRQALGVAQLVSCARGVAEPGELLPTAAGDLLPALRFRCQILCQRGAYVALVVASAPDPLVRVTPRPGRIERLHLASPLLDRSPWPHLPPLPCLGALWALALGTVVWGTLGLTRRAPCLGGGRGSHDSPGRAGHQGLLALQLLSALLVVFVGAPLWWRLGPAPLWGRGAMLLGLGGLLTLGGGLVLCALARHCHPHSGPAMLLGLPLPLLVAAAVLWQLARTSVLELPGLPDPKGPDRQRGTYQLPLREGPIYVRHGGPLLDLVLLHQDGRSCHGRSPRSCRGFGAEVLAPADGLVIAAVDRYPDNALGERDREHPDGNYVLLRHQHELSLLSHLERGSVRVRPGQTVRAGQVLARLGNSGDSDEAHLTMELLAAPRPLPGRRPPRSCGEGPDPERTTGLIVHLSGYRQLEMFGSSLVERGAPSCGQQLAPGR